MSSCIFLTLPTYWHHILASQQRHSSRRHRCYICEIGPSLLSEMRATLRRSCNACAKAKHRCDLRTPHCSRCIKKKSSCIYANEPLTSSPDRYDSPPETLANIAPAVTNDGEVSSMTVRDGRITPRISENSIGLLNPANASFDPFDSYPPTRLPRATAQRLIHHCNSCFPTDKRD